MCAGPSLSSLLHPRSPFFSDQEPLLHPTLRGSRYVAASLPSFVVSLSHVFPSRAIPLHATFSYKLQHLVFLVHTFGGYELRFGVSDWDFKRSHFLLSACTFTIVFKSRVSFIMSTDSIEKLYRNFGILADAKDKLVQVCIICWLHRAPATFS